MEKVSVFQKRLDDKLDLAEGRVDIIPPVDVFEFVFGEHYLHLQSLFPSQSLALKLYYRLWEAYPFTDEEQVLLRTLETKWGIHYDLAGLKQTWTEVFQLVWGRRSSKSSLVGGILLNYEVYKLICLGNPHKHYGILQSDTIYLQVTAAKEEQAKKTFSIGSGMAKACKFFEPYIDNRKDLETELRFLTPYDRLLHRQVAKYNDERPKGTPPRKAALGSLVFWTTTTAGGTSRGGATIVQVFEEFAHVRRARMGSNEEEAGSSGMSDHELYKALAPSTKTFRRDGKIIMLSSPKEQGGEFYSHYCTARGDEREKTLPSPNYIMLQLATWEANPNVQRDELENDFNRDPLGAAQEYGAEFGKPSASFIPAEKLAAIIIPDRQILLQGSFNHKYVVTLDPASRGDTYACAWGHQERVGDATNGHYEYYIDGLMGWLPQTEKGIDGSFQTRPIDHSEVLRFVVDLCTRALARRVVVIAYDQWNSTSAIDQLRRLRLPAMETTFTNAYKSVIYRDFLEEVNSGHVHCYGVEAAPQYDWARTMLLELQYLQRIMRGDIVTYHHPSSGPVQHDDFSDCVVNLVSLLKRFSANQPELMQQLRKQGLGPMRLGRTISPSRGPRIWR
jgi:hypothetical protein